MRRRRQRRDHVERRAVMGAHLLAADIDAEVDHVGDRFTRSSFIGLRGEPGLEIRQQRLGEERVVIGRAMPDLHRLPHRLGDARPGRIDQGARLRARDEHAREDEQQGRVLVAARVQARQRHQHLAAAHVGIADQVEGGIGRDEAVLLVGAEQMRGRSRGSCCRCLRAAAARRWVRPARLRMRQRDGVEQLGDRLADRLPVRLGFVAGAGRSRSATRPSAPDRTVRAGRRRAAASAAAHCRAPCDRTCRDGRRRHGR